jgi:hypothetical protein
MEGPCRAGQATDENMAHAHWMLGILGHKYTLRICNSYFLFIATMVARTRLNVTLYAHCLVCLHSCNKRILEFAPSLLLSSFQSYETPIVTKQWICQYTNHPPLSLINHSAYLQWEGRLFCYFISTELVVQVAIGNSKRNNDTVTNIPSKLASDTQVRGFKPGRSRRIFKGR